MNSIYSLFYRMPRLTFLAIGFIALTGISSMLKLPRQEDPTMTERYATVETWLPGATAIRVESLITEKIENALREIPEINVLESTTRTGHSMIQIELFDGVDKTRVDLVWSEARDQLSEVAPSLPRGTTAPLLEPRGPLAVTLAIAVMPDNAPLSVAERVARELKSRLAVLPGTKETEIFGEPDQEIVIEADPWALARAGLSIEQLSGIIAKSDTKAAAGKLTTTINALVVEVKGELESIERIARIPVIATADGRFLQVADVAHVTKGYVDPPHTLSLVDGERALVVTTTMETGRRVDQWSTDASAIVTAYQSELPAGIRLKTIIDQNHYTNERLSSLSMNLLAAIVLVLIALLVLMGLRAAIIIGFTLPMTMGTVLTGLYIMDIPLHQMSVTGLIIALGLLIDNAIVVVEEYKLNRRRGADFAGAIEQSVRHLLVPLAASTATTVFAFMPIATTPGGVGDFTGAMAVSVILSVTGSFVLAMTIIPTLAGFLDHRFPPKDMNHWWASGFTPGSLAEPYRRSIRWVIEKPIMGIAISMVLPVAGFALATTMTSSFFPPVDRNQFQVQISLPANTAIATTRTRVDEIRELLDALPEVESSQWFIGEGAPEVYYNMMQNSDGVSSYAGGFVTTGTAEDPREILPRLQQTLMTAFPEVRVMALPFEQGPPFTAPIELRIVGTDLNALRSLGERMRLILSETDAVTYSTATLSGSVPQLSVYPRENRAGMSGLANRDLPRKLNDNLIGLEAGSVMEGTAEIPVRVRYNHRISHGLDSLAASPFIGQGHGHAGMPLEELADVVLEPAPTRIDRYQGERINTVSGFLLPYAFPSVALADFRERLAAHDLTMPKGFRIEFGGEEAERGKAVGNMITTFVLYLWLMVAVVVLALNSFRYAAVIGLVGLASVGLALLGVWLSGYPLGYMALIGTLGLIGLAINGAIIVLSALKANAAACEGDTRASAAVVMDATRHIVSTTVTTIGGFLPLIVFGGHFWPPLAMAIAGGVVGSAILALYLVPAVFSFYARRDLRRAQSEAQGMAVPA